LARLLLYGRIDFNQANCWDNACDQDTQPGLDDRIPEVTQLLLELTQASDSILEVGAGRGNFICKVPSSKRRIATEVAPAAAATLKATGVHAVLSGLPELPFADEVVDTVVSVCVFEHLPNTRTVRETFRELAAESVPVTTLTVYLPGPGCRKQNGKDDHGD